MILTDSDYRLSVPGQDVETMVLDVVEIRMQFNELEQWFKDRIERNSLEPIQELAIHRQGVGGVKRLSMMRIMARRTKATTVLA